MIIGVEPDEYKWQLFNIALNNELLPEPVGPNIITNSPFFISIDIFFNNIISLFTWFSLSLFCKEFIFNLISICKLNIDYK